MDASQVGIVTLLLCEQWENGVISDDDSELSFICRAEPEAIRQVLAECFEQTDEGWTSPTLSEIRGQQETKRERQKRGGKAGGQAKARNRLSRLPKANLKPTSSQPLALEVEVDLEVEVEKKEKTDKVKRPAALTRLVVDDPTLWMHGIWTEELGSQQPLALTKLRKVKYRALFGEQLEGTPDPRLAFRAILHAVKLSPHHMSERAYQMPESLFRDESRRDTWVQKTLAAIAGADRQTKGASDFEEYMKQRRSEHPNGNGAHP